MNSQNKRNMDLFFIRKLHISLITNVRTRHKKLKRLRTKKKQQLKTTTKKNKQASMPAGQ
jgi:hypothetical protein